MKKTDVDDQSQSLGMKSEMHKYCNELVLCNASSQDRLCPGILPNRDHMVKFGLHVQTRQIRKWQQGWSTVANIDRVAWQLL